MCIYIYIYMFIHVLDMCNTSLSFSLSLSLYIYIYIHTHTYMPTEDYDEDIQALHQVVERAVSKGKKPLEVVNYSILTYYI